jgi:hypothetical protein
MTRSFRIAVVLGVASMLAPGLAFGLAPELGLGVAAQEPATVPAAEARPAAIPSEDQATKLQIGNLFEVMHIRQQFASTLNTMTALACQQMDAQMKEVSARTGAQLTPEQHEAARKVTDGFMEKATHVLTTDELIDDMTAIYQRHFTKDDIEAAIEFYSSPAGQHMLSEQPAILKEYMPVVMKRMNERMKTLIGEMASDMEEAIKEAKPAGK